MLENAARNLLKTMTRGTNVSRQWTS